jgi:hypothetical protein
MSLGRTLGSYFGFSRDCINPVPSRGIETFMLQLIKNDLRQFPCEIRELSPWGKDIRAHQMVLDGSRNIVL